MCPCNPSKDKSLKRAPSKIGRSSENKQQSNLVRQAKTVEEVLGRQIDETSRLGGKNKQQLMKTQIRFANH